jgi:hypothetical protein
MHPYLRDKFRDSLLLQILFQIRNLVNRPDIALDIINPLNVGFDNVHPDDCRSSGQEALDASAPNT